MRERVAAGLFVLAFALAGVAAGHQDADGAAARGPRCELKLEGVAPEQRRTEGEEPPLVVTTDSSGLVKGHVYSPGAFLVAKQECTGAVPSGVLWESWQGSLHLDGVQFTEATAKVHVYDKDPMGLRTWKGPAGAQGVAFEELRMDIRYGTDIQQVAAEPQDDGSTKARYVVLKYSPDARSLVPYPGAGVTVEERCGGGKWSGLGQTTATGAGEFEIVVQSGCELRGTVHDTADAWGLRVALTV